MKLKPIYIATFLAAACALALADDAKKQEPLDAQKKNYPLTTCVVSDEKLGGMGAPYEHVHEGRLVMLCCKGCVKGFQKEPAKYMKKLDDAAKAKGAKPSEAEYPLATCVVSGEKLGSMGAPYEIKHEGRTVKLCCKGCEKGFRKEPAKYMKMLDDAEKARGEKKDAKKETPKDDGHGHDGHNH